MAVVYGTNASETLAGTASDTIYGFGGNDTINAGSGDDALNGGSGNDTKTGGEGSDVFVYNGRQYDSDTISDFTLGTDKLDLTGLNVADSASLASYVSQVGLNTVITTMFGGRTESITLLGVNAANLLANSANFVFNTNTAADRVDGTTSRDVLFGGRGNDVVFGYNGNDDLNGAGGNDLLDGGSGDDLLRGGTGADRFLFRERGYGSDTITDFVLGTDRLDLRGLGVTDSVTLASYVSQVGSNTVITTAFGGRTESITLLGVNAANLLANAANFVFDTNPLTDRSAGSASRDVLFGGIGNDVMFGYGGDDDLNGAAGNDLLDGGSGDDLLRGGTGADMFLFRERSFGNDTIADFVLGTDRLDLRGLGVTDSVTLANYVSQVGSNTVITTVFGGRTESITLLGVNAANLLANSANFVFNSNPLADRINGSFSNDVLFGGVGNDMMFGFGGDDHLNGSAGNDVLDGGSGDDRLRGGAGVDRFFFSARNFGNDTITDFVLGTDRLDLRVLGVRDTTTLANYVSQVGSDTVITTVFAGRLETITLLGVNAANLLANSANFVFFSSSLPEAIEGSDSSDVLFGGIGSDTVFGFGSDDDLNGAAGNDLMDGGGGDDLLRGGTGADMFRYRERGFGNDTITDFVVGTDRLDLRGLGLSDTSTLANYVSQVGMNTVITTAFSGRLETITLLGVNAANLLASPANFVFNSSSLPDTIEGTDSSDVLFGGNGNDTVFGHSSDDDLNGAAGNDLLDGGSGDDLLRGGAGVDIFRFAGRESGNDTITDFTLGTDRLDLRGLGVTDTTTLANYVSQVGSDTVITTAFSGRLETITLLGVNAANLLANSANFVFNRDALADAIDGTSSADVLFGGIGSDTLFGYSGDDDLNGAAGNDLLDAGGGTNWLRGGTGADTFRFGTDSDVSTIADFSRAEGDRIDFRQFDTSDVYGRQPLTVVSGAFTGAGQLSINANAGGIWTIRVNLDTNLATDEIRIDVSSAIAVTVADLLL